jgi:hypothetical protein
MKRKQCILAVFTIFVWSSLAGCGGGGTGSGLGPMPAPNPAPAVSSVSPNSVAAGAPDTTVTISGSGFYLIINREFQRPTLKDNICFSNAAFGCHTDSKPFRRGH